MIEASRESVLLEFLNSNNLQSSDLKQIDIGLTHPSFTNEKSLDYSEHYERLEFLGDAVLKLVASRYLFDLYPDYQEGELTKIRSVLVSDACLEKFAKNINLVSLIKIGNIDSKGIPASVIACAFEGLLGGLYLSCELDKIENFLIKQFETIVDEIKANHFCLNAKALLQEYTQGLNKDLPRYVIQNSRGPEHDKTFEAAVFYHEELLAVAEGKTKKEAQQNAASEACRKLGILD